jgi:hypothetical protein
MSGRRTNLNKEPFEGFVRHWRRQWVACEDKGSSAGTSNAASGGSGGSGRKRAPKLLKWVQTGGSSCGAGWVCAGWTAHGPCV